MYIQNAHSYDAVKRVGVPEHIFQSHVQMGVFRCPAQASYSFMVRLKSSANRWGQVLRASLGAIYKWDKVKDSQMQSYKYVYVGIVRNGVHEQT